MNHELITDLSSHRFYVDYLFFTDTIDKAYELAKELCVEQSIEFPPDLLPERDIFNRIIREIECIKYEFQNSFRVVISFNIETIGDNLVLGFKDLVQRMR